MCWKGSSSGCTGPCWGFCHWWGAGKARRSSSVMFMANSPLFLCIFLESKCGDIAVLQGCCESHSLENKLWSRRAILVLKGYDFGKGKAKIQYFHPSETSLVNPALQTSLGCLSEVFLKGCYVLQRFFGLLRHLLPSVTNLHLKSDIQISCL